MPPPPSTVRCTNLLSANLVRNVRLHTQCSSARNGQRTRTCASDTPGTRGPLQCTATMIRDRPSRSRMAPVSTVVPSSSFQASQFNSRNMSKRPFATARPANFYGPPSSYEAVVVGAGPAGVTVMGNLLERKVEPILWVDPDFNGGRVNKMYREVPSNTNVDKFVSFAEAVAPFRKIISGVPSRSRWEEPSESDGVAVNRPDKLQWLRQMKQDKGCDLGEAADMILMLTQGLVKTPGVFTQQSRVEEAILNEETGNWTVSLNNSSISTKRIILCHGAAPTEGPLPVPNIPHLNLDTALSPTKISQYFANNPETNTVSVIGASHSAILVLRNLYNLAASTKPSLRIKWFTRHALRYAKVMDGWILRDNTGLKGEVAEWARTNLEPKVFQQSDVSKYLQPINYEKGEEERIFKENLPGSDLVIQAIGYTRNSLPQLRTESGKEISQPQFDHDTGAFRYVKESDCGRMGDLVKLPGMYGAGIAWPERVVDPYGNVEMAVGFFKFMKFVKRVSPEWN